MEEHTDLREPCMPGAGDITGLECVMIVRKMNGNIRWQKVV